MQKKISVIVPVYNAEGTIKRCLDSILSQTIDSYEIILVDDVSEDDSLSILNEYAALFPDIVRVLAGKLNRGAGGARNQGLEAAEGEYVCFVDSDDYICDSMLEKMYAKAVQGNYDIVESLIYSEKKQGNEESIADIFCDKELSDYERSYMLLTDGYIVTKLFKRELLSGISFRENVKLEDADFLIRVLLKTSKIGKVNEAFYFYDDNAADGTWSVRSASTSNYYHIVELMKAYGDILANEFMGDKCREAIKGAVIYLYSMAIKCCTNADSLDNDDIIKLLDVRDLKNSIIVGNYDNAYIGQMITSEDIEIMEYIDNL